MAKKKQETTNVIAEETAVTANEKSRAPETSGWTVRRTLKRVLPPMHGDDVKELQEALIARRYACGSAGADGIFGKNTERAVRAFQGSERLTVDGIAAQQTITALGGV